jgi:PAS domain S-box-containing protein
LGKNDFEIYSNKEIGKIILENDSRIMDIGKEEILEEVVETQDGMRSFISVKTPRYNENGQVIGIVGISHDITERKKTEEALEISEKNYRDLVDNSLVGIFKTNLKGDILFANESIAHMFHYNNVEEFKKKNIKSIYKNSHDRILLTQELEKKDQVNDYELETIDKNGKTVNVLISVCLKDNILSGMFMDITERKKTEESLLESEKRYRTLYSSMNEGLAIHEIIYDNKEVPVDYKILDVNHAYEEILGINRNEILGKKASEIYGTEKAPYMEIYFEVAQKGNPVHFETYFEPMDKYFSINVFSPSSETFVTLFEDISNRKKAEIQIKKSLDEKEVLIREIHHRVKNNLQIIASLLNLQEASVDEEEVLDILKESKGRVKTMAMIHEKLYQSPNFTGINFKQFTEELVYNILYTYGIPTGTIITNLNIEDVNLNIDTAIPLGLIINELITNSIKYAFPKSEGTITIKLESLSEHMELKIADNGIGISEDIDSKNTETLGLQLVNNLVDQLDGEIELDRSYGTEFNITFKELKYKKRL